MGFIGVSVGTFGVSFASVEDSDLGLAGCGTPRFEEELVLLVGLRPTTAEEVAGAGLGSFESAAAPIIGVATPVEGAL